MVGVEGGGVVVVVAVVIVVILARGLDCHHYRALPVGASRGIDIWLLFRGNGFR